MKKPPCKYLFHPFFAFVYLGVPSMIQFDKGADLHGKNRNIAYSLEPEVKTSVESTLRMLGLSASEAVNIFFHQILLHEGLPFTVQKPRFTPETLAALQGADDITAGKISCK